MIKGVVCLVITVCDDDDDDDVDFDSCDIGSWFVELMIAKPDIVSTSLHRVQCICLYCMNSVNGVCILVYTQCIFNVYRMTSVCVCVWRGREREEKKREEKRREKRKEKREREENMGSVCHLLPLRVLCPRVCAAEAAQRPHTQWGNTVVDSTRWDDAQWGKKNKITLGFTLLSFVWLGVRVW